jgi:hypothetical protein
VNLKMAYPSPKHVIILNKIEFSCVWTDNNFVYWVTEYHNEVPHIRTYFPYTIHYIRPCKYTNFTLCAAVPANEQHSSITYRTVKPTRIIHGWITMSYAMEEKKSAVVRNPNKRSIHSSACTTYLSPTTRTHNTWKRIGKGTDTELHPTF